MWCLAGRLRDALSIVGRVLLLALLVGLSSCVQPTVFPRYLTVADVINNVKCQLQDAIRKTPNSEWLAGWTAHFTVYLQVFRQGSGEAELTLVVPYNAPGTFRTGLFGKLAKSGQARITLDFNADTSLAEFMSKNQCDYAQELRGRRNLAGNTGLRLFFGNAIQGVNRANIVEQSTGFTYTLDFVTTLDGSIKPMFNRIFTPVKMFMGRFDLSRQRKDTNQLTVAFAPIKKKFVETGLGAALKRIEEILKKAEQSEKDTSDRARSAEKEAREAKRAYQTIESDNEPEIKELGKKIAGKPSRQTLKSAERGQTEGLSAQFRGMSPEDAREELEALDVLEEKKTKLEDDVKEAREASVQASKKETEALTQESTVQEAVASTRAARNALLAAPARQAPSVSTEGQINQLLIRDALRNIPLR
jgi:hypothetical protein